MILQYAFELLGGHMFRSISVLAFLCLTSGAFARQLTVDERLSDFNQLVSVMRSGYGPLQYKEKEIGIAINQVAATFEVKIKNAATDREFYYLLNQYIAAFHDSHFGGSLPGTKVAQLPITTDLIEGKVLIDSVNREKVSVADFPFERGDEIISIDGRPVADALIELMNYINSGNLLSQKRSAAMYLSYRPAARVPKPTGDVALTIRRGTSTIIDDAKLTWIVTGEGFDESKDFFREARENARPSPMDYGTISSRETWWDADDPRFERTYRCSPTTRIEIPANATVIMKEPFVAYYHPTAKGNVGYLRIPHYSWTDSSGKALYDERFAQYEYAVSVLEKNTVGLIIDQDHNCGGSVEYLHKMVSLFAAQNFKPTQFKLLANKREYIAFKGWVDGLPAHTIAKESLQKTADLIKKSWLDGDFMTPMTSIDGDETVAPNTIRYTKPIVMLIDEMSGSGGDAFPAMMQGIGRAKLLGTHTMGAGGHVENQAPLFYSQLNVRMTKSLFFRPDGVAVENHRVPQPPHGALHAPHQSTCMVLSLAP
jgi:C-terminal processing protease CtpA/Prc